MDQNCLHFIPWQTCMSEYLAIDSGGYLCTCSLCAVNYSVAEVKMVFG